MNKKWIYLLLLAIAGMVAVFFYNRYRMAPSLDPSKLPLTDLEGNFYDFSSLRGKKTILAFGATWCGPCMQELKELYNMRSSLDGIQVVMVSDEAPEKIAMLKSRYGDAFVYLRLGRPFNTIGIYSIPTTYLLNSKLEIKKEKVGFINWKDPSTLEHYSKLME